MANEGRDRQRELGRHLGRATRITETRLVRGNPRFRSVRSSSRAATSQTWGVNFERKVRRLNEDSYWSPLPRIYNLDRVSLAGTVEGLTGLRPGKNLRVKPYAATTSSTLQGRRTTGELDAGLDVKYGVTTGLVWDFTVNTDFSQVEADEQQVNLTRFSLFFPEKRDFFLENSGIFQFGDEQRPVRRRRPGRRRWRRRGRCSFSSAAESACLTTASRFRSSAARG